MSVKHTLRMYVCMSMYVSRMHACMRACACACVCACVCMRACRRACVPACLRACVHACQRACVPACLRAGGRAGRRAGGRAGGRVCVRACVRAGPCHADRAHDSARAHAFSTRAHARGHACMCIMAVCTLRGGSLYGVRGIWVAIWRVSDPP